MSDFEDTIRTLARDNPRLTVEMAVHIADQATSVGAIPIPPPNAPREANAEFAFECDVVMDLMAADKKINAIKELRQITNMGLKEAKEAVELAEIWQRQGRLRRKEVAVTDALVEETIASISKSFAALHEGVRQNGIEL